MFLAPHKEENWGPSRRIPFIIEELWLLLSLTVLSFKACINFKKSLFQDILAANTQFYLLPPKSWC